MHNDEIEFTTPICSETTPHAKHQIAGTWRTECPGVEGDVSAAKSYPRVDIAEMDAKVVHEALPAHLTGDVSGSHYVKSAQDDVQDSRPERNKCAHDAEFIVQGTGPSYDAHGIPRRKVEVKSATGNLSGHLDPSELRRVS